MKCDLVFCDKYLKYVLSDEELDDRTNYSLINLVFIPIKEDMKNILYFQKDQLYEKYVKKMMTYEWSYQEANIWK